MSGTTANVVPQSSSNSWTPKRSFAECHKIMTEDPKSPIATENVVVDGRVFKFYKQAPPVRISPACHNLP